MPKQLSRWQCIQCETVYNTIEEAEACEKHHVKLLNLAIEYNKEDKFPSKILFWFEDKETNRIWVVPGKIVVDEDGKDWECWSTTQEGLTYAKFKQAMVR